MDEKKKKKVLTALECCKSGTECDRCPYSDENVEDDFEGCYQMHWDAEELLEEQLIEIEDLRTTMQSMIEGLCVIAGNNQQRWISVNERLPKSPEEIDCLVCRAEDGYVNQATYLNMDKVHIWLADCKFWINDVTHWMPLPKPYKQMNQT